MVQNPRQDDLTILLRRMSSGDAKAAEIVASTVYGELRRVAKAIAGGNNRFHSLQPTVLVNEAFVRLIGGKPIQWADRRHFFSVAARMMRRIMVDYFREKKAQKRPQVKMQMSLDHVMVFNDERRDEVLMVDEALNKLGRLDPRAAEVVELRYFGGLSNDEVAKVLKLTDRTVKRDWQLAQAWLKDYFERSQPDSPAC